MTNNENNKTNTKRNQKIIIPIIIIIFCMFWAVNYRISTLDLPITQEWAKNAIYSNIESQIYQDISSQNPLLTEENKKIILETKFNQYIKDNQNEIDSQTNSLASYFKSQFQDENNHTYLLAIDPYYYYRFYENMILTGQPGEYEEVNDSGELRSYSNFMLAPTKKDVTYLKKDFHVYFSVWIYKFTKFFNNDINPLTIFFLIPAIFAALSVIPAFFVGREVGGNFGGLITSAYITLHMSVISRTPAGFSDTDIYNIFFPLLAIYFVIKAFKSKTTKQEIMWTLLTTLTLTLYSTAWSGWWYSLGIIGFAYGVKWITKLIICFKTTGNLKKVEHWMHQDTYGLLTFITSILLFIWILGGNVISILKLPLQFISASELQNAAKTNLWPNVFTTVAELSPGSWNSILNSLSNGLSNQIGMIFLIFIIIGIILIWFTKERTEYKTAKIAMLTIWIIATIFATLKGTRFLLMLTIPTGIALGSFFGLGSKKISELGYKFLEIPQKWIYVTIIVLSILILIGTKPIIGSGYNGIFVDKAELISMNQVPSMNDAWYNTLIKIRDNSNETAIISSWWDFGHHFITISKRGASADGGHQNTPQAHWLGKLLLSNDTKESTGILRMLNCGGNTAFDLLYGYSNDTIESIEILNTINKLNKEDSKQYLENKFNEIQIEEILKYTHCNAPESFLITSEDMGCINNNGQCNGKTGVWSHFGAWDFSKSKIWNIVSKNSKSRAETILLEEGLVKDKLEATNIVRKLSIMSQDQADYWISPFAGYITPMSSCTKNENKLSCSNGAQIDLNTFDSIIPTQNGNFKAKSIVYIDDNNEFKSIDKGGDQISIILKQEKGIYYAMYASPEIAESTFTRLFYLNNGGDYFEKFDDVTDVTGLRIITWKVNWSSWE